MASLHKRLESAITPSSLPVLCRVKSRYPTRSVLTWLSRLGGAPPATRIRCLRCAEKWVVLLKPKVLRSVDLSACQAFQAR